MNAERVEQRVTGVLAHTVAVGTVAVLVLILVASFVLPKWQAVFIHQFGAVEAMPFPVQIVWQLGDHLGAYWWAYAISGFLIYTIGSLWGASRARRSVRRACC